MRGKLKLPVALVALQPTPLVYFVLMHEVRGERPGRELVELCGLRLMLLRLLYPLLNTALKLFAGCVALRAPFLRRQHSHAVKHLFGELFKHVADFGQLYACQRARLVIGEWPGREDIGTPAKLDARLKERNQPSLFFREFGVACFPRGESRFAPGALRVRRVSPLLSFFALAPLFLFEPPLSVLSLCTLALRFVVR
ncbi:MAG: hypothetical protein H7Z38_21545 [Rubrivivax sp.]|nr:hypothetical protein [Pyrinomonadaceae bacterium]